MYLAEKVEKLTNVQIIPLGRLVNTIGSNNSDPKKYHQLGRAPYSNQLIASIGTELVSRELSAQGRTSRVLVLDLDNTIWGGVIGEDGLEGIKLDNDYPGNVYIKIQEAIKALRDRGIVLAVCSKNDEKNALKVFHNHESMVLLENDIVAWRINWLTKVENIRSLSEELSLGLSSFAFLDDSPYERDAVSSELPDVNTITWPNDISELPNILLEHPMLQSAKATDSDKIRTKQYHARKKIKNLKESSDTHEQYLSELKMKVTLIDQSENPSERVLQLIEKTNQFNTTTRRHKKDDLLNMVSNGATIYSVSLEDKYSEKETVGVLILVPKDNQIIIETFVLSCRVLGRDIENSIIGFCINILDMVEYSGLFGEFIPSGKNTVAQQSYLDMDFDEVKGGYLWRKGAKQAKLSPWIDIKEL
jgi:FkbH-like protein